MEKPASPVQPADDAARTLARGLLRQGFAALSYLDAADGTPAISRMAFGLCPDGLPLTFVSALAPHHAGLLAQPACAILLGEPAAKGDPLTHPRLMIKARAQFVAKDDPGRGTIRDHWLATHPKAKLYIDFADFDFVRLTPVSALLNGGFARAFHLSPDDLI